MKISLGRQNALIIHEHFKTIHWVYIQFEKETWIYNF